MGMKINIFRISGMHLPNGSNATFGSKGAIGWGGKVGSLAMPWDNGIWDSEYQDFDRTKTVQILNPCTSADNMDSANCKWFDEPGVLIMQKQ